MIIKLSDNILSPLGATSEENYRAIKAGASALRPYDRRWECVEPFVASLLDEEEINSRFAALTAEETYTYFERIVILSVVRALADAQLDPTSARVRFILSTTKGNVSLLDSRQAAYPEERALLGVSAKVITDYFRHPLPPIVVSNACISGVCAQMAGMRLLESGACDAVVVTGADVLSPFVVSGFQSLKALSTAPCKPFDTARCGLNLGEAAATVVYARKADEAVLPADWCAVSGAVRNDANHISGPSRTGEGSYRALRAVLGNEIDADELAFVNAHGTATPYNDEMEAIAIERAGLLSVPVNGLKGYYGHTLGAAGIVESLLSMQAVDDGTIPGTRGFDSCGVSRPLRLCAEHRPTAKRSFIKLISGFGGCNAALLFRKGGRSCK
ncbi:MAG: beta-ketoacyl synthase [Prevotellaceae bacterium]|jgi:3-oxoacyl-[acyl-carrier-protein] synthase-1|nr:beta-ketoacyl synthase [Prevotellaceae bacterium]